MLRIVVLKLPAETENGMGFAESDGREIAPVAPVAPLRVPSMMMRNGDTSVKPVPCREKLSTVPEQGPAAPQLTELFVTSAVDPANRVLIVDVNGEPALAVAVKFVIVAPEAVSVDSRIELKASESFNLVSSNC